MSDYPPSVSPSAHGTSGYRAAPSGFPGAQTGSPARPSPRRESSRWLTFLALAVAVAALALAIAGWFRHATTPPPARRAAPTYSEQQIADAKARACSAFDIVQKGVRIQTGAGDPSHETTKDPTAIEAQAANARLSVIAGAFYLRGRIDPATPVEIADALRNLSDSMSDLGVKYLAGAKNDDPEIVALQSDGTNAAAHTTELCK